MADNLNDNQGDIKQPEAARPAEQAISNPIQASIEPCQDAPQGLLDGGQGDNAGLLDTMALLDKLGATRTQHKKWVAAGLKPNSTGKTARNVVKYYWRLDDVKQWLASRGNFDAIFKKDTAGKEPKEEKETRGERVAITKRELNRIDPDFENVLKRIRLIEQRTFEHYQQKLETGSTMEILAAQKAYKDISTQRTKIELQAPEILKRQSKVIDKETVEKQLTEIAIAIKQEFLTIPNKLSSKLEMKSATEISDILKTELNDILRHISELK